MFVLDEPSRGYFSRPDDLPWGGVLLASLEPAGNIFAEVYEPASRNAHSVRIFGRCTQSSVDRFVEIHALEPVNVDIWKHQLSEWVPSDVRGNFQFEDTDMGFAGVVDRHRGKRVMIQGAFSSSTGFFILTMTSLNSD
jgi:hypothetical protein